MAFDPPITPRLGVPHTVSLTLALSMIGMEMCT